MSKIYGYREEDIVKLAEFLSREKVGKLTDRFEKFALESGKAKGTVRNLYYAVAKRASVDKEFCKTHFSGQPLSVEKIELFSKEQERALIKDILKGKATGQSVRKVIRGLCNDEKTALRFQNKYRNACATNPTLIEEIKTELEGEGVKIKEKQAKGERMVSDAQLGRVKNEINNLVNRISLKERKENELLKCKITALEKENLRLSTLLYGGQRKDGALNFFSQHEGKGVVH